MLRWKGSLTKSFDLKCARKPVGQRALVPVEMSLDAAGPDTPV